MPITGNSFDNNVIASLSKQATPHVVKAIQKASASTGVNFAYLMEQAAAESSFKADSESKTSSATGLYQFIESTWLDMVKSYGSKHGLAEYADKIDENGHISDSKARQEILDMRKNPEKASLLAAEYADENKRYLEQHTESTVGSTELYLAHFLGAGGAAAFLNAKQDNPLTTAADIFPKAAKANHNVFYDQKTGQPRTLAGIHDFFDKKFQSGGESGPVADKTPGIPRIPTAPLYTAYPMPRMPFQNNMITDQTVLNFITHPVLPQIAPELAFDIKPLFSHARPAALFGPAELMMLAAINPLDKSNNSNR